MDVTTQATAAASRNPAGTTRTGGTLAANFDNFLQLLGAQLQNQDPLSPMDANQFTSQLVQFSTVEQAIRTNDQLADLKGLVEDSALTSALGFIGREVAFDADRVRLGAEGGAAVDYQLPSAAETVTITVRDERGAEVAEFEGPAGAGAHRVAWDGLKADGGRAPSGLYRVEVRAVDVEGAPLQAGKASRGRVEGVESGGTGGLRLIVGGVPVPLASVDAVSGAPASPPPAAAA